jgi:hypothetical protein
MASERYWQIVTLIMCSVETILLVIAQIHTYTHTPERVATLSSNVLPIVRMSAR